MAGELFDEIEEYDEREDFGLLLPTDEMEQNWREANDYIHEGDECEEFETDDEVEARLDQLDDEEREE